MMLWIFSIRGDLNCLLFRHILRMRRESTTDSLGEIVLTNKVFQEKERKEGDGTGDDAVSVEESIFSHLELHKINPPVHSANKVPHNNKNGEHDRKDEEPILVYGFKESVIHVDDDTSTEIGDQGSKVDRCCFIGFNMKVIVFLFNIKRFEIVACLHSPGSKVLEDEGDNDVAGE